MQQHYKPVYEVIHQPIWSSWVSDQKEGGVHGSHTIHFKKKVRLFTSTNNPFHTNLRCSGHLVADRSAIVDRVGVHCSFDREDHYREFFKSCKLVLLLAERPLLELPMTALPVPEGWEKDPDGVPRPTYDHGFIGWVQLARPIKIGPRLDFLVEIHSSDEFVTMMRAVEKGFTSEFAQINVVLDATMRRQIS